jgi:Kef-type K+ transport system membrane component KefB
MSSKISPLRDVFVAIFFIAFGMMINPSMFPSVMGILIIAVPLIILNDILITSALAYFVGFSSKGATFLGTSLIGRNEESVFYSTIGTNAINNNPTASHEFGGRLLNPFAGLLCIVMSSLTPSFMKRSDKVAGFFSRILPKSLKFSGNLVAKTLKSMVMPTYLPLYKKDRRVVFALVLFFVFVVALIASTTMLHFILTFLIIPVCYLLWKLFGEVFRHPIRNVRFPGYRPTMSSRKYIENFVLSVVVGCLATIALVAAMWTYWWILTIFILLGYFVAVVVLMRNAYIRLTGSEVTRVAPSHVRASTNSFTHPKRK